MTFGIVKKFVGFIGSAQRAVVYYRVNPDLPEWANTVLKIIAQSA